MTNFRTYQLALDFARVCKDHKLGRPHQDQFQRAVLSIALNLAEGSAKPTRKDQKKFYFTALGSLRETQTIIDLLNISELAKPASVLGAHLYKLCHAP